LRVVATANDLEFAIDRFGRTAPEGGKGIRTKFTTREYRASVSSPKGLPTSSLSACYTRSKLALFAINGRPWISASRLSVGSMRVTFSLGSASQVATI
jgi:hypothetical protein